MIEIKISKMEQKNVQEEIKLHPKRNTSGFLSIAKNRRKRKSFEKFLPLFA